ncbi:MAG TPA: aminopeptidase [Cyclobacteriaceae bacterium]|nr:aminopeptidase [Cyclobacteriaceae bacterium]
MRKKILLGIVLVLLGLTIYYWSLISYGVAQGLGQLKIIREARPVEEFINDPAFPDSLKAKLKLVMLARRYAIDSLGLNDTDNYKTMYDQKGKELMWVIIACEPFRLKEKRWDFPVVGSVPYKGFFDEEKAKKERAALERGGWDVSTRNPEGWSTLGWFTDPILSGMLRRSDGDLASLIIHEMVHATLYVKDSSDFNENLASFIGDRGAEEFLAKTYGDTARQLREYLYEDTDHRKVAEHMLRATRKLDSLYGTFSEGESIESKKEKKEKFIRKITEKLDTIVWSDGRKRVNRFARRLPNNTYFMSFKTYESKHDMMNDEWVSTFNKDLHAMIRHYKKQYPFL